MCHQFLKSGKQQQKILGKNNPEHNLIYNYTFYPFFLKSILFYQSSWNKTDMWSSITLRMYGSAWCSLGAWCNLNFIDSFISYLLYNEWRKSLPPTSALNY